MKFLLRKNYEGTNLFGEPVNIQAGSYLEADNKYVLYNGLPIFAIRSSIAKSICIWADDGHEDLRLVYESVILFNSRIKSWKNKVPVYDENGDISGYEEVTSYGRFTPNEIAYIRLNFSNLITNDPVLRFNDYFYVGSKISEISELYAYLVR